MLSENAKSESEELKFSIGNDGKGVPTNDYDELRIAIARLKITKRRERKKHQLHYSKLSDESMSDDWNLSVDYLDSSMYKSVQLLTDTDGIGSSEWN